jgi:hypothetical protein
MTEKPTVKSAEPESPPHGPESNPPPAVGSARSAWAARVAANPQAAARPTRSRRKKILVPAVLGVIGAAVIVVGLWMYPRRAEVSAPALTIMQITGSSPYINDHMQVITYTVAQARPDVAHVDIALQLGGPPHHAGPGGYTRVPRGAYATIKFWSGTRMLHCSPSCTLYQTTGVAKAPFLLGVAFADFYVRARSYEVAANGVTAAVGLPELDSSGTRQAVLYLSYRNFPSYGSYDWSSFPAEQGLFGVLWQEAVPPGSRLLIGVTSARVAAGVNHAAQQRDSNLTLAAGILFGIGGGALVAAVQEALHD